MIYIDTGPFLARYLSREQFHEPACAFWDTIRSRRESCLTSNFVLDEMLTLLGRRAGFAFAAQRAKNIYASESFTILRPQRAEELKAISVFEKYSDHGLSFTDSVSFVLMRKKRIKRAFTFDRHFRVMGFETYPVE